jgi:hypothetical protein
MKYAGFLLDMVVSFVSIKIGSWEYNSASILL